MTSTGPSAPFINVSCFFEKQLKSHLLAVLDVGEEHLLLEVGTEHHLHLHAASFVPRLKPVVHLLMLQICYRFGHLGSQSCLTGCCSGALEGAVWTGGFALLCFRGSFAPFAFFGFLFLHIRTLQQNPFNTFNIVKTKCKIIKWKVVLFLDRMPSFFFDGGRLIPCSLK